MSFLVALGHLTTPSSPSQSEASPVSLQRAQGALGRRGSPPSLRPTLSLPRAPSRWKA